MISGVPNYAKFMNVLAVAAASNPDLSIMAFSVMSTHFHLIASLRLGEIRDVMAGVMRSYSLTFSQKYSAIRPRLFHLGFRELVRTPEKTVAMNYVLWNPLNHGVCRSPWQYPYSSVECYFGRFFRQEARVSTAEGQKIDCDAETVTVAQLSARARRKLLGRSTVPDNWKVSCGDRYAVSRAVDSFLHLTEHDKEILARMLRRERCGSEQVIS